MYIRPIQESDLEALTLMAAESGVGVTSLPDDEQQMRRKIKRAIASFSGDQPLDQSLYLFALVEPEHNEVVGICAIEARIGHEEVWYNYRLGQVIHASRELGIYKKIPTLFLSNDLTGSTELCTLFLRKNYRGGSNGKLLSRSRYLFLANFADRFDERIIAEMRGYSDEQGRSPFWDELGAKFFSMSFSDADYLTGSGHKGFIAELMPKFPIYLPFLSQQAQAVVGEVHQQTRPALAMLEAEGFRKNNYVDIFDAGPSVECRLHDIRAVRESRLLDVQVNTNTAASAEDELLLVSNLSFEDFRVIVTSSRQEQSTQLNLSSQQCEALNVQRGQQVRVVELNPRRKQ